MGNAVQPSALSAFVTEDNTPPAVLHVNVTDANPTNAPDVHYSVQFSENVTGFDSSACAVTATAGTLNGASVALVTGTGDVYTVRVARGTGDVSFRLDINASPAITDAAGNALVTGYTAGDVYTIEELRLTQDLAANASAIVGETVHFAVTAVGGIGGRAYTWLYSETPGGPFAVIPGATGDTYDLVNVTLTDSGYYYLSLSDTYETVTSTTQHLTVNNGVPVAGVMGMLALTGALAGIAARAQKRK